MTSSSAFSDTLTNLSNSASSISIKLLHWSYGTTSKKSPIREPPFKCEPLNELAVKLQFLPILLGGIKNTTKQHQDVFKDAEIVEKFNWVIRRCDRVIQVLTTGVELVHRSVSEEDEKVGLSGDELWERLICSVGGEAGMQNLRKSLEKSRGRVLVMESLVWLVILQVRGKKNLSFEERERVDCLDLDIESLYHDLSTANMISIPFALATGTGIKAPPRTKLSPFSRPKHRGKKSNPEPPKRNPSVSSTPTLIESNTGDVVMKEKPEPSEPKQHYEAFIICTMHTSSTTSYSSLLFLKFLTRKTMQNNFNHREWGALASSQEEIKSYLRNPNPIHNIEGDESGRKGRKRWQYPLSTMEILLQLPAEVAWSVSNILNSRVRACERDTKGGKRSWSVELVAEWPVSQALAGQMERGKRRIQFKGRGNMKASVGDDLNKMQGDGLKDYLVILRCVSYGKEITVPKYESKGKPFSFTFQSGGGNALQVSAFSEKAQTGVSEKEERKELDVREDKLSMTQKAMIVNDFLASFSSLYEGSTMEERADMLLKIVDES